MMPRLGENLAVIGNCWVVQTLVSGAPKCVLYLCREEWAEALIG